MTQVLYTDRLRTASGEGYEFEVVRSSDHFAAMKTAAEELAESKKLVTRHAFELTRVHAALVSVVRLNVAGTEGDLAQLAVAKIKELEAEIKALKEGKK